MAVLDPRLTVQACYTRLCTYWNDGLWQGDAPGIRGLFQRMLRVLVLSIRGLVVNRALIRASALAYLTGLAMIPIMALLFAILKSLGIQRLLAQPLLEHLAPGSKDFGLQILHYIESTRVASLGVFGIVALLADLIMLMTNVEWAFNDTWQVGRTRPWKRKLSDYLSIFLIFPLLMAVAVSITTNILSHPYISPLLNRYLPGALMATTSGLFSLIVFWLAFVFIYLVMPNTRVNFVSAVIGGLVGAFLWEGAQILLAWAHNKAQYYNAIYGVVYHLLFFTLWLYWSWLILLFGNEVTYSRQNLRLLTAQFRLPPAVRDPVDEYVALAALVAIAARFLHRQAPMSLEDLGQTLRSGNILVSRVVTTLKELNLVHEISPDPRNFSPRYVPAIPIDEMTVSSLLKTLRQTRVGALAQVMAGEPGLVELLRRLAAGPGPSSWDTLTLKDLVLQVTENHPDAAIPALPFGVALAPSPSSWGSPSSCRPWGPPASCASCPGGPSGSV
jgi:membrane protein